MKLFHPFTICFLTLIMHSGFAYAQQGYSIKGSVADTASKAILPDATVYVLNARDSVMKSFSYTKEDGSFNITNLSAGNYLLLTTYPEHADYAENFTLGNLKMENDFGVINMPLKSQLLQEVIIRGAVTAIKIKGDTTEFNARAYVIQPNDKVEDLLKQLPGLQVDKDGKITANGERVSKVLLDGEEFFGDDPTLVTRNIRSDMVDKIQLYDKKSDQATFTGVDDGSRSKTLNVKLKADQNRGRFGKVEGIAGTEDIYSGQGLYNSFKPAQKYAVYATAANNGKVSLGMSDNQRLGASGNNVQIGDVVIVPSSIDEQDGFNGTYNGRGFPVARTGGAHFDSKWNTNKESINTNYKAGYLGVTGVNTLLSEQNLLTGVISSNKNRFYDNSAFRQKLDAAYTLKLDSLSDLKITADGTLKNTTTYSTDSTSTLGSSLLNRNKQINDNKSDQTLLNASAFYTRKFHKPGRTFSWNLGQAFNRTNSTGFQNATLDFLNPAGTIDSTRHIDQYKTTVLSSSILSSNMTLSESLSKTFAIVFNYGIGVNNSNAERRTYNPAAPGVYTTLDTVYSNDYLFNQLTNQIGAIFNYHQGKVLLNFGSKASQVAFKQVDRFSGSVNRRRFANWAPQADFQYRPSQQRSVSFSYNGSTSQPVIDQIQPVRVNTDPLNITVGNPDLKPSFSNNFNLRYRSYQAIKGRNISFSGSYGFTSSAIITDRFTDQSGKTTIRYRNLNSETPTTYSINTVYSFKIKSLGTNVEIEFGANGNHGYNYSNNELNAFKSHSYRGSVWLQKNVQKRYNLSLVLGPSHASNEFSIQGYNNNSNSFYTQANVSVYLPGKIQIASDYSHNYTSASQTFVAQDRSSWNASISRTFLKNDALKLSLGGNDLMNQNLNFNRSISPNGITQSSYNTIRRYFMFALSWDLGKFGAPTPAKK